MNIDELRKMKAQRKKTETSSYINELRNKTASPTDRAEAERRYHVARCYDFGFEGYSVDPAKAYREYLTAAELGHPEAMIEVAVDYANGDESQLGFDLTKAEIWTNKILDLGNPDGYRSLFEVLKARGKGYDAVNALETGVSKGSLHCILWLALLLYLGTDVAGYQVKEDEDRAFGLLRSVNWDMHTDYFGAFELLGHIYRNRGDIPCAIKYYEKTLNANNNCYTAMASLGDILRTEESVRDYHRAKILLENAAHNNVVSAMNDLGVMLYLGEGCEQNEHTAIEWFKKAAQEGFTMAMINLGDIFADENQEEAIYWYKRAADEGNSDGEERLKNLQNNDASYDTSRSDNIYKTQLDNLENTIKLMPSTFLGSGFPNRLSGIQKVIDGGDLSEYEADRLRLLQGWMSLVYFHDHYLDDDFDDYEDDYYAILDRVDELVGSMETFTDEAAYLYNVANMYSIGRFKDIEPLDKLEQLWGEIQTIELDESETEFKVSWWESIAKEIYELMERIYTPESSSSSRQQAQTNNDDYIKNRVMNIISERLDIDRDDIHSYSRLIDDLGADSLDAVELIMEMEKEFNITIPDSEAEKICTVGDVINYIKYNC